MTTDTADPLDLSGTLVREVHLLREMADIAARVRQIGLPSDHYVLDDYERIAGEFLLRLRHILTVRPTDQPHVH
jgi:hypothetical protein